MKKGFTLIELLAVILILGIIALIAIPTVNNILKESRRGAFSSTLTNIEKAIEEKCTTEQIKNQEITTEYVIENGVISPKLDIKGSLPDGVIYVSKTCEVSYTLSDNNFTGTKEIGGEIVIVDKGNTTTVYKEEILNGTDPVITGGLIPVTIANDGTVKKADLTTKWYSYAEKKWANSIILTDTGKVEEDGTILESSIESYFVWIPRYKYKLFDMGNYTDVITGEPTKNKINPIDIVFETKDITPSVGTSEGDYYTHPAFKDFDVNGLWVAKFETTGAVDNVQVKPNQRALGNLNVKDMFEIAYNYNRNNESHMMKNTEWGAVTYLTNSNYGSFSYININNNDDVLTGYSSVIDITNEEYTGATGIDASITLPYNTETGYRASTTGNITGIYDMSGGAFEYVASYLTGQLASSGFTSDPATLYGSKYFDLYASNTNALNYKNRILGDATGEFGPFYYIDSTFRNNWWGEASNVFTNNNPWVYRGGGYTSKTNSGQLFFAGYSGVAYSTIGFRMVLAK